SEERLNAGLLAGKVAVAPVEDLPLKQHERAGRATALAQLRSNLVDKPLVQREERCQRVNTILPHFATSRALPLIAMSPFSGPVSKKPRRFDPPRRIADDYSKPGAIGGITLFRRGPGSVRGERSDEQRTARRAPAAILPPQKTVSRTV